jgi:hypothetical protein
MLGCRALPENALATANFLLPAKNLVYCCRAPREWDDGEQHFEA